MSKNREKLSLEFQGAICQMQDNLRYLKKKGSVSTTFLAMQNKIIQTFINYFNNTESVLQQATDALVEAQMAHSEISKKHYEQLRWFKAICTLHGIIDLPRFQKFSYVVMESWAGEYNEEGRFMQTAMLRDYIKRLPPDKGKQLDRLLDIRNDEHFKELLKKFSSEELKKIMNNDRQL